MMIVHLVLFCFVAVQESVGCVEGDTNLALRKPTSQSSVSTEGEVPAFSSGAVDGNRGGYYGVHPVTVTNPDSPSWWEVDLEQQSKITSISLYNRIDCCSRRLTNFSVILFDYSHWRVHTVFHGDDVDMKYRFDFPDVVVARYVRVQLSKPDYLSLAEVEVYGRLVGGYQNVAYLKNVASFSGMPVINSASKSMDQGVWWAVDLEKQYEITAVTLHVFTSSTSGRSHSFNAILRLLDGNKTEVLRNPYRFADGESIIPLPVSPPVTAKHVQIQLKEENGTTLDIVEVFTRHSNLALQKSATQSRTYSGAVAALAVDGKRDNSSTLVARTKWSSQSWWEVDLEYSSNITSVSLYNHVKSPLTNFLVQLFDYKRWPVRNVTQIENRTANVNYDFDFPEGTVARYVRVQLMEEGELLLEEVEVYGTHLPEKTDSLQCSAVSEDNVTCTWYLLPTEDVLRYRFLVWDSKNQLVINETTTRTHHTLKPVSSFLNTNSNYTIEVKATSFYGRELSAYQNITTQAASAPVYLNCVSPSQHTIRLTWKEPTYQPSNLPVTGYIVTFNNSYFQVQLPMTKKLESDIKGLEANATYWFEVTAWNAYGSSSPVATECMTLAVETTSMSEDCESVFLIVIITLGSAVAILFILLIVAVSKLRLARKHKVQIPKGEEKKEDQKKEANQYVRTNRKENVEDIEKEKQEKKEEEISRPGESTVSDTSYENVDLSLGYVNFQGNSRSGERAKNKDKQNKEAMTNLTANEVYGMERATIDQPPTEEDNFYMTVDDV